MDQLVLQRVDQRLLMLPLTMMPLSLGQQSKQLDMLERGLVTLQQALLLFSRGQLNTDKLGQMPFFLLPSLLGDQLPLPQYLFLMLAFLTAFPILLVVEPSVAEASE